MRRSMLFVPANDEKKIRKSSGLRPDSIIFDLEDSVPQGEKERARSLLARLLEELEWPGVELCVRINPLHSVEGLRDLVEVSRWDRISCIVVPKAEEGLGLVYRASGRGVVALVETSRGVLRIEDIARSEGVEALTWGPADLALSMGASREAVEASGYVRILIPLVASAYGIEAIDKVFFSIEDLEGLRRECLEAKALGYTGKTVIHPRHVEIAAEVFTPSREEIEWAERVVKAYEEASSRGRGAIRLGDQMIDAVHYRTAKRILESLRPRGVAAGV